MIQGTETALTVEESPEVPKAPEAPEVPKAPEAPEVPKAPEEAPEAPKELAKGPRPSRSTKVPKKPAGKAPGKAPSKPAKAPAKAPGKAPGKAPRKPAKAPGKAPRKPAGKEPAKAPGKPGKKWLFETVLGMAKNSLKTSPLDTRAHTKLRELIANKYGSGNRLANALGINQPVLWRILSHRGNPSLAIARRIAKATKGHVRLEDWAR